MNGKYVTTLLNVFAVFALFVGVTGILDCSVQKRSRLRMRSR